MKQLARSFKAILKRIPAYTHWQLSQQENEYNNWVVAGKPVPPPHRAKQLAIIEYAKKFGLKTFVETGTYLGDMVAAMQMEGVFDNIFSIELSPQLHGLLQYRFSRSKKLHLLQGDSGCVLKEILKEIDQPVVFWLDGHYSSGATSKGVRETPIEQELEHIFNHPLRERHVILIDDARTFTGQADYPTTQYLREFAKMAGYNSFDIKDDIIRILNR